MHKHQAGFTLIELVIVIVILGLLAATALPKFADLTDEARGAALSGVAGDFRSAIAITHAQWLAEGSSGNIRLQDGSLVQMNASGWPDLSAAQNAAGVFDAIMSQPFTQLGNGWSDDGSTGGTSTYTLAGNGGGNFTYNEDNGAVNCAGC